MKSAMVDCQWEMKILLIHSNPIHPRLKCFKTLLNKNCKPEGLQLYTFENGPLVAEQPGAVLK